VQHVAGREGVARTQPPPRKPVPVKNRPAAVKPAR